MSERTTIPKRVRFAVMTRDGFRCYYCGTGRDDGAKLTIDHVVPVALGGDDDPGNLVTACEPCNSGKSSVPLDAPQVAAIADDAVRWSAAMQQAASEARAQRVDLNVCLEVWSTRWNDWGYTAADGERVRIPLPGDWQPSVRNILECGADIDTLVELIDVAMTSKAKDTFRYWCGCAWNHVRALQDRAKEILAEPTSDPQWSPEYSTDDLVREAYWEGHVAGYDAGHQDGWEGGIKFGRHGRDVDNDARPEPVRLDQILAIPKEP
ncbi:HNH endonuclease [Nocardioides sp. ChNu-99]|uniref:HNH endonuclease n=1 Tax=Nocardioides sp. ChNu-99 TaxID=2839897 RepID=UPI002405239F|nr:HNH endonuclease [Nocardioides sp. ChNu-99]MDF9718121.1 HNH endonuclease [Nocardioides sp. ChNu-99]